MQCFSAHDVLEGVNASSHHSVKEEEFELATGYIVLQLVDKHCIESDHDHGSHNHTDHGHGHNHTDHGHGHRHT